MYKPKDTKEIYVDSLNVNSSNLEKQLAGKAVSSGEIGEILQSVDSRYKRRLNSIVEEYEKDMMALEHVPSPLRLFIDCLAESDQSMSLSPPSRRLIQQYISAWEEWM